MKKHQPAHSELSTLADTGGLWAVDAIACFVRPHTPTRVYPYYVGVIRGLKLLKNAAAARAVLRADSCLIPFALSATGRGNTRTSHGADSLRLIIKERDSHPSQVARCLGDLARFLH